MNKKILIYNSGGGLGDTIQLFNVILSLQNHFEQHDFYYLGAHNNHFNNKLKEFNIRLKTLELDLKFFGFRWWHLFKVKGKIIEKKIDNFDLVIDLQTKIRNTLILKQIPCDNFFSLTYNFFFCTRKKKYINKKDNFLLDVLSNIEIFFETKIERINFNLNSLSKKYIEESKRLLPGNNYIGLSLTQGNKYRLKTWPINNFIQLANKYLSVGKKIVFFVEKSEIKLISYIKKQIPGALFPESESLLTSPALVTALASRLEKAISIDNGVMHMLALAQIPMVTLFGPTNSKKFSPKIKNIKILDSKEIYNTDDITKITIEDVFTCSESI